MEGRPDSSAEIAASGEAANVSCRGVLTGGPGADPARRNAKRRKAPIVVGERGADDTAKCRTNVGVGCEKTSMFCIGRHGAARVEDLGPPGTRPEEAESPLSIRETTDGVDEGTGLGDAAAPNPEVQ